MYVTLWVVIIATLSYLSWIDIKTLKIPLWSLFVLGALQGVLLYVKEMPLSCQIPISASVFVVLSILTKVISHQKKQNSFGSGDIILCAILMLTLPWRILPLFFLLSGVFGVITHFLYGGRRYPFVPALSLAFILSYWLKNSSSIN